MKYRKFLTNAILTSVICLLTVLAFTTEKADAWGWYGFSSLCFQGEIKSPAGDVVCTVTLEEVTIKTACDNINSDPASPVCHEGEAHSANLVQTIEPEGIGTKEKKYALVDGCFDLSMYDDHDYTDALVGHIHTCPTGSVNMVEILGSGYVQEFVALWECSSVTTGKIINIGRDTCEWNGVVDPDTCIPNHMTVDEEAFTCVEEILGKKWTLE